ncbi:DUF1080 domain-containing protein [Marinilongibacter aquaticus]|uniref:3-keto-disaccharide hydrolase n=1 Tax=Marinilongibacter aquaticus TaxID=2975157 RepID=UPI0021BD149C|nr:DUF1080 domain-containing protein [Marinilongibacter aquaticus]UBM59721.1 DUF1080 domain-containing protein [Marinilongibacter aquaticus]
MKLYSLLALLIAAFTLTSCSSSPKESQDLAIAENAWTVLFDGEQTHDLRGYGIKSFPEGVWYIEEGKLTTNPDTANRDLVTNDEFKNFELEYDWAVDTAANSGVFFHVQEKKAMESGNGNSPNWLDNFEIQILDDLYFPDTAKIRSAGALYDLIIPQNKELKTIGEFNHARLKVKNKHVEHWLNGHKVLDFEIGSKDLNQRIANSKFKDNPDFAVDTVGHIMFQHHGQKVYFKNIRIREI